MKRIILHIFFFLAVFLAFPQSSLAHVLKIDESIGAVMHIQPEDDPVAGEESSFYFEFKDKKNTFDPKLCECTFSVTSNGQELYSQPLFQNNSQPSLTNASVYYTFPKRGVYVIKITGKPLSAGAFDDFTLSFNQRVERNSDTVTEKKSNWFLDHLPHFSVGIIGFSLVSLVLYKKHTKKGKR